MSFVLQSLEILETNQTYTAPAMEWVWNKQTNDLNVIWREERKNQKFMAINFVTIIWNTMVITEAEFRKRDQALKGT